MFRILAASIGGVALAAAGLTPAIASTPPGRPVTLTPATGPAPAGSARACPVARPGYAECLALYRTSAPARSQRSLGPDTAPTGDGYGPADLQSAYNLASSSSTAGSGQTIAIVDAYDDPNAASDLATYRSDWNLPACGTGCFTKVNETGATAPLPAANANWAAEESLDLDMVSAICPNCHILLVEVNSTQDADLGTGVNTAVSLGAQAVSNSYGGPEPTPAGIYASDYNHPGVAITSSSGDSGYRVQWPAASPYVTAVGGTTLTRASSARGWTETAWSDGGSGCSTQAKPGWQTDSGCGNRTEADTAADADPASGVAIYDTYGNGGWFEVGGTSASAPIIAGVYGLAGTPAPGSYPSAEIYSHTSSLYDVTSGSNGSCSPAYLCTAGPGYDGPTGWGTPDGLAAFTSSTDETTDLDTASAERNLLTAGSFEGSISGWSKFVPAGPGVVVNLSDDNTAAGAPASAQDGSWYLATNTNTNTGGGGVYQDVPVSAPAGASFVGTAWLSAQSGTATGKLCLWGIGSTSTSNCRPYSVTAGKYTLTQVVYDTTASIGKVRFQLHPDANSGTTDLDTASLVQNLLTSGSLEGSASGWTRFVPSGPGVVVNLAHYNTAAGAPATAQDGTWYEATNTNTGGGGVYQDVSVSASAGASYVGTAWLAAQSGTATGKLCLWGIGSSGSTSNCRSYSVTGSYTPVQVVYDTTATIGKVRFQVYPDANSGTTDIDTASLAPNLLKSGSFEGSVSGWSTFVPGGTGVHVNLANYNTVAGAPATAQDGNWYLATNTNTGGGGVYQDVSFPTASASFVGTAWLSAQSSSTGGRLCVWGLGATNTSNCRPYSVNSASYEPVQVVYDSPAAITTLRFQLYPNAN